MTHPKPHGIFGLVRNYSWASCYICWEDTWSEGKRRGQVLPPHGKSPRKQSRTGTEDLTPPGWAHLIVVPSNYHITFQKKGIYWMKVAMIRVHGKELGERWGKRTAFKANDESWESRTNLGKSRFFTVKQLTDCGVWIWRHKGRPVRGATSSFLLPWSSVTFRIAAHVLCPLTLKIVVGEEGRQWSEYCQVYLH